MYLDVLKTCSEVGDIDDLVCDRTVCRICCGDLRRESRKKKFMVTEELIATECSQVFPDQCNFTFQFGVTGVTCR